MAQDWLAEDFLTEDQEALRDTVSDIAKKYDMQYWIEVEESGRYPSEWVQDLTDGGWLSLLIPEEYGGGGGTIPDAALFLETLNRWGGNAGAIHAQMYQMGAILRHGTAEQKQQWLPQIANDGLRLQSFGITEPDAGTDTTRIKTFARREGDEYVVNGGKIYTSRFHQTDLMLLLVRTEKYEDVEKKTDGITVLLVDVREAKENGQIEYRPIKVMSGHHTNQLSITNLRVPVENRIGEEGKGFKVILSGMNSERLLVSSEYIGSGLYFIDRAVQYSKEREVFGRPIGMNQGIQFPLADSAAKLETAELMVYKAAWLYDHQKPCGKEANIGKYVAAEAAFEAADRAMQTHGGYGYIKDYDVERYWREVRLFRIAPISQEMILNFVTEHVLGLPRSY